MHVTTILPSTSTTSTSSPIKSSIKSPTKSSLPTTPISLQSNNPTTTNKSKVFLNKFKHKLLTTNLNPINSKSYQNYLNSYSSAQIDLENPPLPPPTLSDSDSSDHHHIQYNPTTEWFSAPLPPTESTRQRILNRLGYHQAPPITSSTFNLPSFPSDSSSDSSSHSNHQLSPTNTTFSSSLSSPSTSHSHASFAYLQDLYLRPKLNSNSSSNTTTPSITSTTTAHNNSISNPINNHLSFSLIDHPDLHALVKRCQALFSVAASMVSMLDDDRNVYLAENGLNGLTSVRRDLSYCSHTILNGDRVFAVLDTSADWRFSNPPTVEHQATRFYAGAPIFAPHLPGLIDSPPDKPACIGTICVVDGKPRKDFTKSEREMLMKFASECQNVISNWFLDKIQQKIQRLDQINLSNWMTTSTNMNKKPIKVELSPISPNTLGSLDEEVEETKSKSIIPSLNRTNSSARSTHGFPFLHNSSTSIYKTFRNRKSNTSTTRSSVTERMNEVPKPYQSPTPTQMTKFDLATKILAETLELSMVYIVAVLPTISSDETTKSQQILVISSHNVPTPAPVLDYDLHIQTIRKGSEGLIFNKPPVHHFLPPMKRTVSLRHDEMVREEEWDEVQAFAYDRKFEVCLRERRRLKAGLKKETMNRSGILLMIGDQKDMKRFRVSEEVLRGLNGGSDYEELKLDLRKEEEIEEIEELEEKGQGKEEVVKGGFVIEGYSLDPKRVLGIEDLVYFQHFSKELEKDLNGLFESHCF